MHVRSRTHRHSIAATCIFYCTDLVLYRWTLVNLSSAANAFQIMNHVVYLIIGILFGIALTKGEVISWFRIQEMFRFQGFYMYGLLFSAILTAMIGVQWIQRFGVKTFEKEKIVLPKKQLHKGVVLGGMIFGVGWAITGVCPGPMYAQLGAGITVTVVTFLSALAGTLVYSYCRPRLPH